ncbi:FUSC family protein [Klebsiella michiganensis]|uniref:FUSC family protein n=1 Tax=Klebsiella michiganensis TaxID=1134687 RepID=UPI0018ABD901|nr:FUSC family protein [Klebsiella michiganensis]ELT9701433.1 FUSC family protein [Klebsiella michiganensis]ELT9751313.1 FUSC family protein [Klebsiella michiganensis]ELT9753408.1 FUSC family protein [Klebsiella michiganensis]MBF8471958.1 FUSC family protein [Klebsiella michiganensis]MBZ6602125.1 FUSC family protein [Klebsiella michiganensis]
MSTLTSHHSRFLHAISRWSGRIASPSLLSDAHALLYSVRSFAAAMLAYYVALAIGLERPSWAIITVYIVSQTSVGASLSRSLYRLAGTVAGAGATVLIVPTFVNTPILCSVILAGWITFCLYLSLLERTPRAYAFVLAGYTASLIGFPAVADPGTVFNIALIRVQEIAIGIVCAALIHRYILPARISGLFNSKLAQTLHAARQRIADTLAGKADAQSEPLHLALALQFLQGISHHIPYDFALSVPARQARKALHDRLARLVIVNGEVRDRLQTIAEMPAAMQALLNDVQVWLTCDDTGQRKNAAEALQQRSAQLARRLAAQALTFEDALRVNFLRYIAELITLLQQCERLSEAIHHARPAPAQAEDRVATGYVFHRDPLSAARTALGAFVIILSGCLLWIYSAWPDGGTAVSILGVCCTLFGSFDTPAPHIVKYIIGSVWGVVISLIYSFALLPPLSDFPVLVAVLAPVYLLAGSLQARPPTTFMAMGITLTLPVLCELGARYSGDFADAANTAIALFFATGFAVIGMSLLQTVQADAAIKRLLKLCQRDIRRSVSGVFKGDETHWTNLMIDRAALLLPRLPRSGQSSARALDRLVHFLRIGLCVMRLRRCETPAGSDIHEVLSRLTHTTETEALRERIAAMANRCLPAREEQSCQFVDRLVDLHCALRTQNEEPTHDK